jgi:hypothetical protein
VLRRIFVPKREEVAEGWRRLHNAERPNLYVLLDIVMVIQSRCMKWRSCSVRGRDEKYMQHFGRKT